MNELLLRGAVALDHARRRAVNGMVERHERGDIVQTVLIVAMFVLIVVVVGALFYDAIFAQGKKVTNCIKNANTGSCSGFTSK